MLDEILIGSGQKGAVSTLGQAYGIKPSLAEAAAAAVLPQFAHRIERLTLSRGGIADLVALFGNPDFQSALNDPTKLATPDGEALGLTALEELLWRKDISRKVAARASAQSGVDEKLIKKLLPGVAALTIGALAKGSQNDLTQMAQRVRGNPLPLPDEKPRGGGGDVGQQIPLPVPSDDFSRDRDGTSYDDLSDMIRKGRRRSSDRTGSDEVSGRGLGSLVRDILGKLLGFENRGFVGWLVNLLVMRILLPVISRIISRVLFGR